MAENINISFAPNKAASESQRIADLEQYVSTLTERTKFAFASIIEEYNGADTDKTQQILNTIYQSTSESGSDVGQFTNTDKNCEIFNDYANNVAQAYYSHAEGYQTTASAPYCHSEGSDTIASAPSCHTEGAETKATNNCCHAEGYNTEASGGYSHAEGRNTKATGWTAHAEGESTVADGMYSHAEGEGTVASGNHSHAGGFHSEANASYSFAHGMYAITNYTNGAALGRHNKTQDTLFVVGNGEAYDKSDALTLSSDGELWVSGSIKSDGFSQSGMKGIAVKGSARFGEYWTTDSVAVLLAIGNGTDANHLQDALTLDGDGNLTVSGKYSSAKGYDFSNAIASDTVLGAIKVGANLSISEDGTLSASGGNSYVLPTATANTLGGVKIGDNVSVTADGTISVDLSAYLKSADISDWAKQSDKPTYTASEIGLGNVDNTADADKPISTATQTALDGKADTGHTHTVSDITDMPAYLTEETDPTVPAWAKAESKPVYTAEEVGAAAQAHTHTKSQITDFPESLPANGGNADTVDGKHASDFATARHTHTATEVGAAPKSHTHSKSDITDFPTAMKNPSALTVQMNGTTAAKYDGGTAKTVNITPSGIGAATAADITAAVNAVEIGGRNLLYHSKFDNKYDDYWIYSTSVTYLFDGGYTTMTKSKTTTREFTNQVSNKNLNLLPENGCSYTMSCEVMKVEGLNVGNATNVTVRYHYTDGTLKDFGVNVPSDITEETWRKCSYKFTYSSDKTLVGTTFMIALGREACGIKIKNVKFEKGNKPTDWTPAPEDDERRIASLEARVAALEAAAVSGGE